MTDALTKAAQAALDALDNAIDHLPKPYSTGCSNAATDLRAALAAQPQQAAQPVAPNIRAALQQAYLALEELDGPGYLIGGVMHHRISLLLPMLNKAIDSLADAAAQPQQASELSPEVDAAIALLTRMSSTPDNWTTPAWKDAIRPVLAGLITQGRSVDAQLQQATIYCAEKRKPGGCQLHNLHCGWPKCNEPIKEQK